MKKYLAFVLAMGMMLTFAACGHGPEETTGTEKTEQTTAVDTTSGSEDTTKPIPPEDTTKPNVPDPELPKDFDAENIIFSFAAVSDTHINNNSTDAVAQKIKSAFKQLKARAALDDKNGLDAVFVVGDMINSGYQGQYGQTKYFREVYESVFSPTEVPMIYAPGNHDIPWTMSAPFSVQNIDSYLGEDYFIKDVDKEAYEEEGNRHCVVNGFHVITLAPVSSSPVTYTEATKIWLDETLAKITAENPNQFVFVLTHPMIQNTVYGSDLGPFWYTSDITDILSKYNQVVTFGGHLHFPLNDPRSIMQTAFTSLGCGSVRYMAIEDGKYEDMAGTTTMNDKDEFSQGLLVQIDKNGNMRVTRMDFYHEAVIGEDWTVSYPTADGAHLTKYTRDRGNDANNAAPVMAEPEVILGTVSGTRQAISFRFAAGQDDEFVHHYEVAIIDKETGNKIRSIKLLGDFYRHANTADMKKTWSRNFGTLPMGKEYVLTVTAYDSWNASVTVTKEFKTDGDSSTTVTANLPAAYVDIDFAGGAIKDAKGRVTVKNKGASVEKVTVTAGGKSATVDALRVKSSGEYVLCTFNELGSEVAMKQWAQNGFTVEAFYVMGQKGSAQGVVCGTESGGWGVAEDKTGKPYFITGYGSLKYNTGAYAEKASSTSELVHVVAVYDFDNKEESIYVNGVLQSTQAINGDYCNGAGLAFNKFCLGNDIKKTGEGGDFACPDMTMVDVKIYDEALTAGQASTAYKNAMDALK